MESIPPSSLEVFALPGHGRTSFLWAMLFTLRQLSRVWPGYLCWPLDAESGRSLVDIHQQLRDGHLPEPWSAQSVSRRYALHLRNMNPWGERFFVVWDRPDPAFSSERQSDTAQMGTVDWNRPALWLLSLADLDDVPGRFLDLTLDNLIRVRHGSGEVAREHPLRLILVFTKADSIPDLPTVLRAYLKEDPLAKALATASGGLFKAHDEIDLYPIAAAPEMGSYPQGDPLGKYLESCTSIDKVARDWMNSNSAGRALLSRATDLGIDLRFSMVSATGSGLASNGHLATAWSPRRILDPYFWSLELGG